jgi:hypothetical protein
MLSSSFAVDDEPDAERAQLPAQLLDELHALASTPPMLSGEPLVQSRFGESTRRALL